MVQFIVTDNQLVCEFSGNIETAAAMRLENEVEIKVSQTKKPVRFDLKNVSYISSAFLRICLATAQKVGKDNFSVTNPSDFVLKIFKVAGLESLIK